MQHSFDVNLAEKYGLLESILFNNIAFWVEKNRANGCNFFDGKHWTYNSVSAFARLFPYATEKQIRRALQKLQDENLIETGHYSDDARDRTLWYTTTDFGDCIFLGRQPHLPIRENVDLPVRENELAPQGKCIYRADINTDINTDNKPDKSKALIKRATPTKESFGEYGWVRLTEAEHNRLVEEYGLPEVQRAIAYMDESAQITGNKNKWKDWNLVVRKCIRDGWGKQKQWQQQQGGSFTDVFGDW